MLILTRIRPELYAGIFYLRPRSASGELIGFCSASGYWLCARSSPTYPTSGYRFFSAELFYRYACAASVWRFAIPQAIVGASVLLWIGSFLILRGVQTGSASITRRDSGETAAARRVLVVLAIMMFSNWIPFTLDFTGVNRYSVWGTGQEHHAYQYIDDRLCLVRGLI